MKAGFCPGMAPTTFPKGGASGIPERNRLWLEKFGEFPVSPRPARAFGEARFQTEERFAASRD
jgi:hypothetical protein